VEWEVFGVQFLLGMGKRGNSMDEPVKLPPEELYWFKGVIFFS